MVRSRGSDARWLAATRRRVAAGCGCALLLGGLAGACSDDLAGDDGPLNRRCGDGICDSKSCETPLRCPTDCGTCAGDACTPNLTPEDGNCDGPCSDSCSCAQENEVCTADFDGSAQGTCVPLGCRLCSANQHCVYSVEAAGKCGAAACEDN
jgi:hypothetical protein